VRDTAIARVGPSAVVLTYHRVADLASDPQLLAVSCANFASQAEVLSKRFRVVPLAELVEGVRSRSLVDGAIAITFDDGYADNLENAAPVLAAHGLPATVFVSSGYLGSDREFWWDDVERIVLADELGRHWNALEPPSTTAQREYLDLMRVIHNAPAHEREATLSAARERFGIHPEARASHRPMTDDEAARLAAIPGIDIGGHTVDHEVLSALSPERQAETIASDRNALESVTRSAVATFSYPYGQRGDFTRETERMVAEAGYAGAVANYPGLVKTWTDPYRIPRFVVRDWDAPEFARRIDAWFAGSVHKADAS